MLHFLESDASSALGRSSNRSWRHTGSTPPRGVVASARTGSDRKSGVFFFSQARQQLEKPKGSHLIASSYGVAAQAVLQGTRHDPDVNRTTVRLELGTPPVIQRVITSVRKQSHHCPFHRESTRRTTASHVLPRTAAIKRRSRESTVAGNDYLARLQNELNACETVQSLPSHDVQVSWQHRRSASMTAGTLPYPRRPEGKGSGRRRQSLRSTTPSLGVTTLVKQWVKTVEEKAAAELAKGSAEGCVEKSPLPMSAYCMLPSHTGPLSMDSCIARLRKSKFRPISAFSMRDEPCAESVAGDVAGEAVTQPLWRERLLAEPIQSYRVLKDVVDSPVKPTPSSMIRFRGSGRIRRENLERLRHSFEHQRFKLQGELEDQLMWRDRCRSALVQYKNRESEVSVLPSQSPSTALSTPQATKERTVCTSLLKEMFGDPGAFAGRSHQLAQSPNLNSSTLRSVWSQGAARQAVAQEKSRIVALLQSFAVTCSAAALTLADMEELRAETIRRVWHPEEEAGRHDTVLFHREQFLNFLWGRYEAYTSGLLGAVDTVHPIDIIDALPSQAEASFAEYAYEILPTPAK
ncbi:hypothetical protein, conserved [Leishmania tarentolae]|uniref:Uncharacterized protein n=1 Tax=Leishmania tarentolae TaxID=5689 RepID=A0A640KTS9_LEITA|nr:hypothetical protein, conserved [Leishmania tarentolae]